MKIDELNKINNDDYIVLLPQTGFCIKDGINHEFKNVIYVYDSFGEEEAKVLIDFFNNHDNNLLLVDYSEFYRLILPYIDKRKKIKIDWLYKNNLACITNGYARAEFNNILEFYDRDIIDSIVCLDKSTYRVLKNAKYRVKQLLLDIEKNKCKSIKSQSIGIIGDDYNENHNVYNELSSLKMVDYSYVKMIRCMPATEHFINFFDIKEQKVNTLDDVIKDNDINLYCNFTFTNNLLILKSMDMGIPCLLGNTDIFDDYKILKESLVLESDDDIREIANKIENIRKNKKTILDEYEKFRVEYSKKVLRLKNEGDF